ncbi:MAG: histone deacetylase [Bacteroidia bacterium]
MLKIAHSKIYAHPLPEGHRFPMLKYELIPEQLLRSGIIEESNLFEPSAADEAIVLLTHDEKYVEELKTLSLDEKHIRRIGFPLSEELVKREFIICGGSIQCCDFAIAHGVSMNTAGGTHHAFSNKGEGFCLLNDMAVAANYLLHNQKAAKILFIDLDVHQGNGTASLFEKNKNVFTFSMHGKNNFPFFKEQSDLDIELNDGCEDEEYLFLLQHHLSSIFKNFKPDFVFYNSGVDILSTDKLGKLKISEQTCYQRDRFVFELCKNAKTPVVTAMGGGYSSKISDIVNAHCNTFRAAVETFF